MQKTFSLADIKNASHGNRVEEAQIMLRDFLQAIFPLQIMRVEVRKDALSLNSVNGFIHLKKPDKLSGADILFFKFHHEENEEGLKEYYNSKLLAENGFPVEMPIYASHEVGKQVLLYPFKSSERMADVCKHLDTIDSGKEFDSVISEQHALDVLCCERYLKTLHEAPLEKVYDEPLLQLFYYRLLEDRIIPAPTLGGRHKQFYAQKVFEFPGSAIIGYEDLAKLSWRINGLEYAATLKDAFKDAFSRLAPKAHSLRDSNTYPAVVAHGDAHNGNVWYNTEPSPGLSLFDPAFAGPHIPALLAEIKPTFHNIFAHPLWLYDAQEADGKLDISFNISDQCIEVEHNWTLSTLRQEFLAIKRDAVWKPLLKTLRQKNLLPEQWQDYMRSALFCCPTLVMNLRANAGNAKNSHTPKTSLLALSIAMTMASAPVDGADRVSEFFNDLNASIL